MEKLFILLSSLVLSLGAFSGGPKAKAATVPEENANLATLIESYKDDNGNYVKRSKIYFSNAVLEEARTYLHAGTNRLAMTTYYDEDYNGGGALLMGDYDGKFTNINSGYATDSQGRLAHYTATNVTANGETLFSERNVDYTVNSTCNVFFDVLSGVAAEVRLGDQAWTVNDGVYTHAISDLSLDTKTGEYNDLTLKRFQYFAAPMLLQSAGAGASHYLTFSSIKVEQKLDHLSIRLYVSTVDSAKVTTEAEGSEYMLSEAKVYKGFNAFYTKLNDEYVDLAPTTVTEGNIGVYQFVAKPGDKLEVRQGVKDLTFFDIEDKSYTYQTYGTSTVYINWKGEVWPTIPTYYAKINGEYAEAVDIKGSESGNNAEFAFNLKKNDELTIYKNGGTQLHFYHWSEGAVDDGAVHTADADYTLNVYCNSEDQLYTATYGVITIYFDGEFLTWDDPAVNIALDNNWQVATATEEGDLVDGVKITVTSGEAYALNCYLTQWGNGYWHPAHGDEQDTNYSVIDIGDTRLLPGHSYKIHFDGWKSKISWDHQWFNYTFSEVL